MYFRLNEKMTILSVVTKKATNKTLKTTIQFLYFLSAQNFLKDSYLMKCLVFFLANNLLAPTQSGFKPGGSCINQLLSITHEIYSSFEDGFEVRSVFLDISKAFDKVWREGIIFKLQQNSISDDLLNILSDFLRNRKQRVMLNGQSSSWTNVNAGIPQGSILGPLLF